MPPYLVYTTAAVIVLLVLSQVFRRSFDPFAPIWLFLTGYVQVYVVQALTYREYGLRAGGPTWCTPPTCGPSGRCCGSCWCTIAVRVAGSPRSCLDHRPGGRPRRSAWSTPFMVLWGLFFAGMAFRVDPNELEGGMSLFHSFPMVMLVAGIWLIVTGRNADRPRPNYTIAGVGVTALYVLIWMFNGKRSHSLIGVLTGVCAFYVPRFRRPSKPVLGMTALAGVLAVSLAIGWRGNQDYEHSFSGFFQFVTEFDLEKVLVNLNVKDRGQVTPVSSRPISYETEEWGGYLLMMDTVPRKSSYDYGSSYMRLFSTFIPRLVWKDKPVLRPRRLDQRLDRRVGDATRAELHRTGHQHSGGDPAQWRCLGHPHRLRDHRAVDPFRVRILPPLSRRALGSSLVGLDLLQRLADDRQR